MFKTRGQAYVKAGTTLKRLEKLMNSGIKVSPYVSCGAYFCYVCVDPTRKDIQLFLQDIKALPHGAREEFILLQEELEPDSEWAFLWSKPLLSAEFSTQLDAGKIDLHKHVAPDSRIGGKGWPPLDHPDRLWQKLLSYISSRALSPCLLRARPAFCAHARSRPRAHAR